MSSLVPNLPRLTIVPKLHLKPGIFTPDNLMHLWTLNIPYSHVSLMCPPLKKEKRQSFITIQVNIGQVVFYLASMAMIDSPKTCKQQTSMLHMWIKRAREGKEVQPPNPK